MSNLIDDVSRILAAPMPRRTAIRGLAQLLTGVAFASFTKQAWAQSCATCCRLFGDCPAGMRCCGFAGGSPVCASGRNTCCGAGTCPSGSRCCNPFGFGSPVCASGSAICCGTGTCPSGSTCCNFLGLGSPICASRNQVCCGFEACPAGCCNGRTGRCCTSCPCR